jgi:cardiolipin synthase (CMP-forming)
MVRTVDPAARIVTVPNIITVVRLVVLTPAFVVLLLVVDSPFWALIVAAVLGGTDWVDGQVARRFDQVSDLGKKLDPVADRISQFVVCATLVVAGLVPLWMALVILVTDLLLGVVILIKKPGIVPVRWIGRIRTALLMVGLPFVLLVEAFWPDSTALRLAALCVVGVGVVLHAIANLVYVGTLLSGTAHAHPDAHPDASAQSR